MTDNNKLLYEQILDFLRNKILNGELKSDEKLPTELELAKEFKVSRITSKRALEELKQEGLIYRVRGSGSFVVPMENVKKYAGQMASHQPNLNKIISMVVPLKEAGFGIAKAFADGLLHIVQGVSEILNENGYFLSIHGKHNDVTEEKKILHHLYQNKVKGIIYYPISDRENLELLNTFYLEEFPIVTIDKYFDNIPMSYVVSDNAGGSHRATQYLIDLAHVNIAFVSNVRIESASSVRQRYFGYCRALKENNISINEDFVKVGIKKDYSKPYYEQAVYEGIIRELIEKKVTAIITENDIVASFLMRAALHLNIKVPREISIVGFDDLELARHLQVPLTTVSQNFYAMGSMAARVLIDSIESGRHSYRKIILPAELMIRNSCTRKH